MASVSPDSLSILGIHHVQEVIYNPSYETLYAHETDPELTGWEQGVETALGSVSINTGKYTGRSPKDKYIVQAPENEEHIWWHKDSSDNQPITTETWTQLHQLAATQLSSKTLYVMDGFCGANPDSQLKVRLVTEIAWMAHFFKNMFIRPTDEQLKDFSPDFTILNACKTQCDQYKALGLNSPTFVAFNLEAGMTVIGGTWYSGEIKKGIFSVMNYLLPMQGIGSFHCSANMSSNGETALFFGLSGTGKTTLSTDPKRRLIGDDEHGWDDEGVFNLEGGCYAKLIHLSAENEPDIYQALKRNALLENVVLDDAGHVDFDDSSKTQNTRASYPIEHIDNIVKPHSVGGHPNKVIFLTCDAYGVLPPVSKLTKEQAMYQYLSGYTAKVAGTELGVNEPTATFSACFGQPFLLMHPIKYAEILGKKMDQHQAEAYLVNTGWTGGAYGVGHRISIKNTRAIIDAILSGSINESNFEQFDVFNFMIPASLPGVDATILNPINTWSDTDAYLATLNKLAEAFTQNFSRFNTHPEAATLSQHGPLQT